MIAATALGVGLMLMQLIYEVMRHLDNRASRVPWR